jgi:hypothetical protein
MGVAFIERRLSLLILFIIFYSNSFLPSSIKDWNDLPVELRNAPSLAIFKKRLNEDVQKVPAHHYIGERRYQIIHTRLRTHCSSLKEHLFSKKNNRQPFLYMW